MSISSGKGLTLGDGLDSLALAIFILGMIYMIGTGIWTVITHSGSGYTSSTEARCKSLNGYYGNGKCYVEGNEI